MWSEERGKLEDRIDYHKAQFQQKIPFDPFGVSRNNILNSVKSDYVTKDKQIEIIQKLKKSVDNSSDVSLVIGFENLFSALKNLLDGSMPVFNEYQYGHQ